MMSNIEIKWDANDGKKYIFSEEIIEKIEIDEDNKEIKNAKAFFREIIYQSYLKDWDKQLVLVEDQQIEIAEVCPIINELINICNSQVGDKKKSDSV